MELSLDCGKLAERRQQVGQSWALFFDIDGTIFKVPWIVNLVLACADLYPEKKYLIDLLRAELARYEQTMTYNYAAVLECMVEIVDRQNFFHGIPQTVIESLVPRLLEQHGFRRYRFTHTIIDRVSQMPLTERGLTVAVTGSPMDVVQSLCQELGIDGAYGTIMHAHEGLYTGRLDLTVMNNKGHVVRHLAAELGIDLAASAAFGDSSSDLPMLKEVGYPFAMNPDAAMLKRLREFPKITVVQDRQKSGLQFYRAGQDGLFKEVLPQHVLPPYFASFSQMFVS